MLRPTILMSVLTIAALAFAVFQVENQVKSLNAELAALQGDIRQDRESIHVLEAEWSYLNQPDRLRQMAESHLGLEYVKSAQVKDVNDIPLRPMMVSQDNTLSAVLY